MRLYLHKNCYMVFESTLFSKLLALVKLPYLLHAWSCRLRYIFKMNLVFYPSGEGKSSTGLSGLSYGWARLSVLGGR